MCECEWDVTESGVGREYSEVLSKKKTVEDVQFDLLQVKRKEKKKKHPRIIRNAHGSEDLYSR